MNESTVSSAFQKRFRETVPEAVVIKHADKSMIGMVDASITYNKRTLWVEYKFIGPNTKGVTAHFLKSGIWSPHAVASASPTQFDMARRLATTGNCLYLFWVLDHQAVRKRVAYITAWHPITQAMQMFADNDGVVDYVLGNMTGSVTLP
jgi:hypothetical protein